MIINIESETFDTKDITQLYPAAIVKTGYNDETTQVSLEWLEIESKGKVELEGYAIFVHLAKDNIRSFTYSSREELDSAIARLALQLQKG
ncbi:Phosphomannomutase [hydrothermal vent metagenome]|uniref:Phosphomannomutase n=1 Tax=hydrothermal vent metagenome TaxID=652676 RepID=A0A1W1BW67_9ZZZZ